MFTYSDHSSENYLEDQRQKTPWQPDTAEMELKKTTREDNLIKNRLTSRVKEVVNGSTLLLENGEIVKYIGAESPDFNNRLFQQSKNFNMMLVDKKEVKLQFDIQGRDSNGNMLAYVYAEGIFVNAELVKKGLATFLPHPVNIKYHEMFTIYQNEAKKSGIGIWGN